MRAIVLVLASALLASNAQAQTMQDIISNSVGCKSKDDFDKAGQLATSGDGEAFKKFVGLKLVTKDCRLFDKGEKAFLEDSALFRGAGCLRVRGEVDCYWVPLRVFRPTS